MTTKPTDVKKLVQTLKKKGATYKEIITALNDRKITTPTGLQPNENYINRLLVGKRVRKRPTPTAKTPVLTTLPIAPEDNLLIIFGDSQKIIAALTELNRSRQ